MSYCKEHPTWIYVRYTTNDVQSALRRQADLFEEAGSHGLLVRGTSFDKCGGNSLKDRDGLRSMLDAVKAGRVESVMIRDLDQISRNSYLLVGVIESFPPA